MKFPSEKWVVLGGLKPTTMTDSDNGKNFDLKRIKNSDWCEDAILIVNVDKGTTGITNIGLHTSDVSGVHATTSNICTCTQDVNNSTATTTISSNDIAAIVTDGRYIYEIQGLSKYITMQFDGDDSDSIVSMILLGLNPTQSPGRNTSQAAYS